MAVKNNKLAWIIVIIAIVVIAVVATVTTIFFSNNPEKTIDWAEIARECSEALDWLEECLFSLTPLNKIVN